MAKYVRQSKEERRKKRVRTILIVILSAAVIIAGAVVYFRKQVQTQFASSDREEVETATVTIGSIKTTVSGSGNLTSEGVLDIELPVKVTLEETLVEAGDKVEENQMLATVKVSSVMSSLKELQEELEDLDDEIDDAKDDTAGSAIYAGVSGRVKAILVEEGDDVSAAMAEHGALMILSLDGYMAVDIPAGDWKVDDEIEVTDSEGDTYDGTVSKVADGKATVLITDNGPLNGDTVTVGTESGTLYIHSPLKVTGYAGTIEKIREKENAKVKSNTRLISLDDTEYSAGYEQLLAERSELEEIYQSLVRMYQDGGIRADRAGTIRSIEELETISDTSEYAITDTQVIMTLDPNETVSITISVDESNIQSLDVGQEASITVESISEDAYTGVVSEIDKTATSSGGVTLYTATITMDKTEDMLSGMSADVAITIEGVENALLVPEDAVRKTSATSYVYTTYDEETGEMGGMVEVTTGLSNGSYIEITSGLSEGDTVYYTEQEEVFGFGNFNFGGGMGGNMGGMPSGGGGFSGMPGSGGNRGNSGMPSGGMPGGMPGGR